MLVLVLCTGSVRCAPLSKPKTTRNGLSMNLSVVSHWLGTGAIPRGRVRIQTRSLAYRHRIVSQLGREASVPWSAMDEWPAW